MNENEPPVVLTGRESKPFFLPDFCTARSVVTVMVVAQLTAFVLVLARSTGAEPWMDLLRLSLFLHWIALCSAGALCVARRWLAGLGPRFAVAVALVLLVAVATLLAEAAWITADISGLGAALVPAERIEFRLRTVGLSFIVGAVVLRYLWLRSEWRRRVEAEAASRLAALQARIRPHFLFNSMNTIASLTRTDAQAAEQSVEDLADLFRASLADADKRVTLGEELDVCRRYLRIESLRLGERMQVRWDTDALPLDARVPGLLLQPLLENAVYHGVEPSDGVARIGIIGAFDGNTISIEIRNPLPDPNATARRGNHLALENVAERLSLSFPSGAALVTAPGTDEFVVTIRFPYEAHDAAPDRR